MKKLVIGILAHVDAGKTTLSEAMLYLAGAVRRLGRVDHRDAFLDTDALERERGITIFSKQAVFSWGDTEITLLDTPGHVDFSAEMERTLQVLDAAVLVISGPDGVQAHTRTLWRLLARHGVPTFLFINKMDQPGTDPVRLMALLRSRLDEGCVNFSAGEAALQEDLASADETLLEAYLEGRPVTAEDTAGLILRRQVFPCWFGAALGLEGVEALLEGLDRYAQAPVWPAAFAARVFKIAREGGDRLTYLKITGGALRVREVLPGGTEKVNQIRLYSGTRYRTLDRAEAGTVCAVTGISWTRPGDALGAEPAGLAPSLEPVLTYQVLPPAGGDVHTLLQHLRQLEEEDPQLRVLWNEGAGEIHIQLMGEIQLEVMSRLILERFGTEVSFGEGSIVYKETIAAPALGVGHFEPLRHYAEVHLLLEPLPRGSGLHFASLCGADQLEPGWQRLILTHLAEKPHRGVLTGSVITDMKISLLTGRAHLKHTEGGDFRQATYRAVRQGLMGAQSVLLEPWYRFRLEAPQGCLGRAMGDIQAMGGTFDPPVTEGDQAVLTGAAPVAGLRGYWREVAAYTRGLGSLSWEGGGYRPCRDQEKITAALGYEPDRDLDNPAGSVFCAHGAGYNVPWDQVPAMAHVKPGFQLEGPEEEPLPVPGPGLAGDRELEEIFVRTYGPVRNRGMEALGQSRRTVPLADGGGRLAYVQKDDCLVVDGYNIIFAWEELRRLAAVRLDDARNRLIQLLSNYRGVRQCRLILVFDAYKVKGNPGKTEETGGLQVVYTKEGETADQYIERLSYELGRGWRLKVATSDGLERVMVLGHGAQRISAEEFRWEVDEAAKRIRDFLESQ